MLEKSQNDWNKFVEKESIKEELDSHNRSKNSYLDKQDFLAQADYNKFVKEKESREQARKPLWSHLLLFSKNKISDLITFIATNNNNYNETQLFFVVDDLRGQAVQILTTLLRETTATIRMLLNPVKTFQGLESLADHGARRLGKVVRTAATTTVGSVDFAQSSNT